MNIWRYWKLIIIIFIPYMEKLHVIVAHLMAQRLKQETCEEMEAAEGETVEEEACGTSPRS